MPFLFGLVEGGRDLRPRPIAELLGRWTVPDIQVDSVFPGASSWEI
ncbi:hypothetical protein ACTOB_002717 [Actinoplanes oblitus]|uniref:Transposase n=1 Tax=Actinoplanes oblitus TaxID=3040509 RepID=A0ABY8WMF9_9ACTN|nr:hypothetical protein [Actinoplanes oblitus]WIM99081.1 hypothetical protein ACTOB_002717 [Actinoplanes oblitus]